MKIKNACREKFQNKIFDLCEEIVTTFNRFGCVMVSVPSVVDRVFEPRSGKTKDYKIGICRFSAKHTALLR